MTPTTVGEMNAEIRQHLHGPGSDRLMQAELDVLDRERRLAGWKRAAELHAELGVEGVGFVCAECTRIQAEVNCFVAWPCRTALALGLAS